MPCALGAPCILHMRGYTQRHQAHSLKFPRRAFFFRPPLPLALLLTAFCALLHSDVRLPGALSPHVPLKLNISITRPPLRRGIILYRSSGTSKETVSDVIMFNYVPNSRTGFNDDSRRRNLQISCRSDRMVVACRWRHAILKGKC